MSVIDRSSPRPRARPIATPTITRQERARAAILDAAMEFLWSNPFRDLTVAELMKGTDVSRSAFYQYFDDLHGLMENLLNGLEVAILEGAAQWFSEDGDPVPLLREALAGLVKVCYERGPLIRAVADAAPTDSRLEAAWTDFLERFDQAVAERIEEDQRQGLIPPMDARTMAFAFNRMDAYGFADAFGARPRSEPGPILDAITRIWISSLYGELESRRARDGSAPVRVASGTQKT